MPPQDAPRCPVCQASFRSQRTCTRCGADLAILMRLVAQSWLARRGARAALRAGDLTVARQLAAQAQKLRATPPGRRLLAFVTCMQQVTNALATLRPA